MIVEESGSNGVQESVEPYGWRDNSRYQEGNDIVYYLAQQNHVNKDRPKNSRRKEDNDQTIHPSADRHPKLNT
jgi:hypothetical protein